MSLGIEVFEMKFSCSITWEKGETEYWDGVIDRILDYGGLYEIFIKSRSSIQVFIGRSSRGIFACIPDFRASCHISSLDDIFYNTENLIEAIDNSVDGTTVAFALRALAGILKF